MSDTSQRHGSFGALVHYRILSPVSFEPLPEAKRLGEYEYVEPDRPELELADELGSIRVLDWKYTGEL